MHVKSEQNKANILQNFLSIAKFSKNIFVFYSITQNVKKFYEY
jgi:hypothetical protein